MPFAGDSLNRYLCVQQPSYGTANLGDTVGGSAWANSNFESGIYVHNANDAFDNDNSSFWTAANGLTTSTAVYLDYTFASAVDIETMNIRCANTGNANHSFKVAVLTDESWVTTHTGLSFSTTSHSLKIHRKNVTKVRITPIAGSFGYWATGSHCLEIYEVDFLGAKS